MACLDRHLIRNRLTDSHSYHLSGVPHRGSLFAHYRLLIEMLMWVSVSTQYALLLVPPFRVVVGNRRDPKYRSDGCADAKDRHVLQEIPSWVTYAAELGSVFLHGLHRLSLYGTFHRTVNPTGLGAQMIIDSLPQTPRHTDTSQSCRIVSAHWLTAGLHIKAPEMKRNERKAFWIIVRSE